MLLGAVSRSATLSDEPPAKKLWKAKDPAPKKARGK
eukprot:gene796-9550_t